MVSYAIIAYMKNIHIPKNLIDKTLATVPTPGKRLIEPFAKFAVDNSLPMIILEDNEATDNVAELHVTEGDLWHCLQGEAKFILGGELLNPYANKNTDGTENKNEWKAKSIKNGEEFIIKPGDWLWIPPNQPHHRFTKGTSRFVMIKVPSKH